MEEYYTLDIHLDTVDIDFLCVGIENYDHAGNILYYRDRVIADRLKSKLADNWTGVESLPLTDKEVHLLKDVVEWHLESSHSSLPDMDCDEEDMLVELLETVEDTLTFAEVDPPWIR